MIFQATNLLKKLQENQQVVMWLCRQVEHLMEADVISQDFADISQHSIQWAEAVSYTYLFALHHTLFSIMPCCACTSKAYSIAPVCVCSSYTMPLASKSKGWLLAIYTCI